MVKTALITGYSSQIGRLLAELLIERGFKVYAGMRKVPSGFPSSRFLIPTKLDLKSDSSCQAAIPKNLNLLINIAGRSVSGQFSQFSPSEFLNLLNLNTVGPFRLLKYALPAFQSKPSYVINITSLNGLVSTPGYALYSASKHAIQALGWASALEMKSSGIHIVNVAPGAIVSPANSSTQPKHQTARQAIPFLKFLLPLTTPQHVVSAIINVINKTDPPPLVLVGRDAHILYYMQRYLPNFIWFKIQGWVWRVQSA